MLQLALPRLCRGADRHLAEAPYLISDLLETVGLPRRSGCRLAQRLRDEAVEPATMGPSVVPNLALDSALRLPAALIPFCEESSSQCVIILSLYTQHADSIAGHARRTLD